MGANSFERRPLAAEPPGAGGRPAEKGQRDQKPDRTLKQLGARFRHTRAGGSGDRSGVDRSTGDNVSNGGGAPSGAARCAVMNAVTCAAVSEIGRARSQNDDRWFADPEQGLFLV